VGPRAVLDAVVKRKIPRPRGESNPRTPIVQPVAQRYTTELLWEELIIIHIYKKADDCSNYGGLLLLPTAFNILFAVLVSRLTPRITEIIGDHQCGFRRKRSTNDHMFCARQILEKSRNIKGQYMSYL
jgi:hypothetical protein